MPSKKHDQDVDDDVDVHHYGSFDDVHLLNFVADSKSLEIRCYVPEEPTEIGIGGSKAKGQFAWTTLD